MIFILLKSRRLRLQLLAGLLLALMSLPERCGGMKCFSCDGPTCGNPDSSATKECSGNEEACFKSDFTGSIKRGCYSKAKSDCIQKTAGHNCYSENDKNLMKTLRECTGETDEGKTTDSATVQGITCVCAEDLCNGGPVQIPGNGPRSNMASGRQGSSRNELVCYKCELGEDCSVLKPVVCENVGEQCLIGMRGEEHKIFSRGCFDKRAVECVKAKYDRCTTLKTPEEEQDYKFYLGKCTEHSANLKALERQGNTESATYCLCDTSRCNVPDILIAGKISAGNNLLASRLDYIYCLLFLYVYYAYTY